MMASIHDSAALLSAVREHISTRIPLLARAPIRLRPLDGPPDAPRYSADAELCCASVCPRGIAADAAAAGLCHVHACPLRSSIRLLLDGQGHVIQEQCGDIHWS
ncbi:MAG: hypothetical protein H7Y32_10830 [Chloroflexales bacterium]|nr:hypothetical protein [Chloroflexales bacterium]